MQVLELEACLRHVGVPESSSLLRGFKGACMYYHYGAQRNNDRGWGCGYRTLQTILSWYQNERLCDFEMPSLVQIQEILNKVEDKPKDFVQSRQWIGAYECGLITQYLTKSDFRILHIPKGKFGDDHIHAISNHFDFVGSPIMMGGCLDNSSKALLALCLHPPGAAAFLVCDPHLYLKDREPTMEEICEGGWLKWRNVDDLNETNFYNLCLPL